MTPTSTSISSSSSSSSSSSTSTLSCARTIALAIVLFLIAYLANPNATNPWDSLADAVYMDHPQWTHVSVPLDTPVMQSKQEPIEHNYPGLDLSYQTFARYTGSNLFQKIEIDQRERLRYNAQQKYLEKMARFNDPCALDTSYYFTKYYQDLTPLEQDKFDAIKYAIWTARTANMCTKPVYTDEKPAH